MSPQTRRSRTNTNGNGNGNGAALSVEAVEPAPRKGRKGTVAFPAEAVKTLADTIRQRWAGDGQVYATRAKANLRVTRLKRALIHYGHYSEPKQIKSRVWEDDGKFRLALIDAAHASAK